LGVGGLELLCWWSHGLPWAVSIGVSVEKGGVPMQNVVFQLQGNQLVIVVDLSQELGLSQSQKSMIIASTGGNVAVPGCEEVKVGLNVYRPVQTGNGVRR
jgi:hypothetical protein